jgi:type IV secretory pathway TraG/TraD family ATPase VirD4
MPIAVNLLQYLWATCLVFITSLSGSMLEYFDSLEPQDNRHHNSAFATDNEFINDTNTGFVVNGTDRIPRSTSFEGMLVTGATGSGKGINIIIPNVLKLLDKKTSLIIHSPSGDTFVKTSGQAYSQHYEVIAYRFNDHEHSDFYNPFDNVHSNSDAYSLAGILADSYEEKSSSDPFWKIQGTLVLYMCIAIVTKLSHEFRTLKNVRHLLIQFSIDPRRLERLFVTHADDELMETFLQAYSMEDKVLRNVVASALAYVSLWSDDNVARVTSQSSFSFDSLRSGKPKCIYIMNSVTDMKLYAPIINVFFAQLTSSLLSRIPDPKSEHDVMLIMDEMASIKLPNLPTILQNCRKHYVGVLCAYQQISSIRASHPHDWDAVMSNLRTKVYLGGMGLDSSENLEKLIGREDLTDEKGNVRTRYLMTQEALRTMTPDTGIALSPVGECYRLRMRPYFEDVFLNMKAKRSPVRISRPQITQLPLTPIHAIKEK